MRGWRTGAHGLTKIRHRQGFKHTSPALLGMRVEGKSGQLKDESLAKQRPNFFHC